MSTEGTSSTASQIVLNGKQVAADDVAKVWKKTGTFLGRLISRIKLSWALGMKITSASLEQVLNNADTRDIERIQEAYDKQIGDSQKGQVDLMSQLKAKVQPAPEKAALPQTSSPRIIAVLQSLFDRSVSKSNDQALNTGRQKDSSASSSQGQPPASSQQAQDSTTTKAQPPLAQKQGDASLTIPAMFGQPSSSSSGTCESTTDVNLQALFSIPPFTSPSAGNAGAPIPGSIPKSQEPQEGSQAWWVAKQNEWAQNATDKGGFVKNKDLLVTLINNLDLPNRDLYSFMQNVKIKQDGTFLTLADVQNALTHSRQLSVQELYAQFSPSSTTSSSVGTAPAVSPQSIPKNVIPWSIPQTVSISIMMLDQNLSPQDRQAALALTWSDDVSKRFPCKLKMPFITINKQPHQPIQGMSIRIPASRPQIVKHLRGLGYQLKETSQDPNYPWTLTLDRKAMDKLLAWLGIPLSEINHAKPTDIQLEQLPIPKEREGIKLGVAKKAVILEEVPTLPSRTKENVMDFFEKFVDASNKDEILARIRSFWDDSLSDQEDGPKARAILQNIAEQFSNKQSLVSIDKKLIADVSEALTQGCFVAKFDRLKTAFDNWRGAQQTGGAEGIPPFERAVLAAVAEFKEAIVIELTRKCPQSVHLVSYLKQRWATLFGFNSQQDHAAKQGPSSLEQIGLTEKEAAQEFINQYCATDPHSPYPNKTVLFKVLYEKMLSMQAVSGQALWNNPVFGQKLLSLVGNNDDIMSYLLQYDENYAPQGLRPEAAELILISMGLLPGTVEEKVAAINRTIAQPPAAASAEGEPPAASKVDTFAEFTKALDALPTRTPSGVAIEQPDQPQKEAVIRLFREASSANPPLSTSVLDQKLQALNLPNLYLRMVKTEFYPALAQQRYPDAVNQFRKWAMENEQPSQAGHTELLFRHGQSRYFVENFARALLSDNPQQVFSNQIPDKFPKKKATIICGFANRFLQSPQQPQMQQPAPAQVSSTPIQQEKAAGATAITEANDKWVTTHGKGDFTKNRELIRSLITNLKVSDEQLYEFLISKKVSPNGAMLCPLLQTLQNFRHLSAEELYATFSAPPTTPKAAASVTAPAQGQMSKEEAEKKLTELTNRLQQFDRMSQQERTTFYAEVDGVFPALQTAIQGVGKTLKMVQEGVAYNKIIDRMEDPDFAQKIWDAHKNWSGLTLDLVQKRLQKKAQVYRMAYARFLQQGLGSTEHPQCVRLQKTDSYTPPQNSFLTQPYAPKESSVTHVPEFYDYSEDPSDQEHYWTDFANRRAGGGFLELGFVQEEIMVQEMPEFAQVLCKNLETIGNYVGERSSIYTRDRIKGSQGGERVGQGTPNPFIMKDLHRVLNVDTAGGRYGHPEKLDLTRHISDREQHVNVLAMAAPNLQGNTPPQYQYAQETLTDLLGTFLAGFSLVAQQTGQGQKKNIVHTGPIGCGAFKNDPRTVFFLQCLAAEQVGVDLKFHKYHNAEALLQEWNTKIKPQLQGKSLGQCIEFLSGYLPNPSSTS